MRYIYALMAGGLVTLGLFYFMSTLISQGKKEPARYDDASFVDFIRVKQEENLQTRNREIPKKPPPPQQPPSKPKLQVAQNDKPQAEDLNIRAPALADGLKGGMGPYLGGGGGGNQDAEEMPIVRIQPQYPQKARMRGIEGFATVQFTITKSGSVRDPKILEANPPRVFDRAAMKAVLKWRYKPKLVDGEPVERVTAVTLEFNLAAE